MYNPKYIINFSTALCRPFFCAVYCLLMFLFVASLRKIVTHSWEVYPPSRDLMFIAILYFTDNIQLPSALLLTFFMRAIFDCRPKDQCCQGNEIAIAVLKWERGSNLSEAISICLLIPMEKTGILYFGQ